MTHHKRLWTLILLGLAIGAIILLAAGLSEIHLLPGHHFAWPNLPQGAGSGGDANLPDFSIIWQIFGIIFWILLPISIIYFIISPEARKRVLRDAIWIVSMVLMLYLLAHALQRFARSFQGIQPQPGQAPPPAESLPAPADFVSHPPSWLVYGLDLLVIALVFTVVWFLWTRLRRKTNPVQQLAQEAEEALSKLRDGGDLKNIVMRCYRDMTRVLSEARGIQRRKAMTPREFAEHLRSLGLRDDHVQRLTRLFETVRYGAKTADVVTEREAQVCLEAIVAAYGGSS